MSRPRTIPGLLVRLARIALDRADHRKLAVAGLAFGAVCIGAGIHGLARPTHCPPGPRPFDSRAFAMRTAHSITHAPLGSGLTIQPTLVVGNGELALAWVDGRENGVNVLFERLTPEGRRIGNEVVVTRGSQQHLLPRVAFTGSEYGITWTDFSEDNEELHVGFARVGNDGALRGEAMRLSKGDAWQFGSTIATDGSRYRIVWNSVSQRGEIGFRSVGITPGQRPDAEQVFDRDVLPVGLASIAWDGREYGLVYGHYDYRRERVITRQLRMSADGRSPGTLVLGETTGIGGMYDATRANEGTGATWITFDEQGESSLWFARTRGGRIDAAARRVRQEEVLGVAPSIAWRGAEGAIAWTDRDEHHAQTWFARVNAAGTIVGTPLSVATGVNAFEPSIVWTGREYAMAFTRLEGRTLSIRMARFDAEGRRVDGEAELAAVGAGM